MLRQRKFFSFASSLVLFALFPLVSSAQATDTQNWLPAYGSPEKYLNIFVSDSGTVGVCSGDNQLGVSASAHMKKKVSYQVSRVRDRQNIQRNLLTDRGEPERKMLVSSQNSFILAAFLSKYKDEALKNKLQAESYTWGVSGLLTAGHYRGMGIPQDGGKLAQRWLEDARKIAGPYTIFANFNKSGNTIEGIRITGAEGKNIPRVKLQVNLKNANFLDGYRTRVILSSEKEIKLKLTPLWGKEIKIEIKALELPADYFLYYQNSRWQDMVVSGNGNAEVKLQITKKPTVDKTKSFSDKEGKFKENEKTIMQSAVARPMRNTRKQIVAQSRTLTSTDKEKYPAVIRQNVKISKPTITRQNVSKASQRTRMKNKEVSLKKGNDVTSKTLTQSRGVPKELAKTGTPFYLTLSLFFLLAGTGILTLNLSRQGLATWKK
ncbi:hypothetical protein KRX54_05960 [Actinomycetaceae bacterium TAE3-ERU4]|nr:hypothetical protein [Actinomycetaceae bacterium TAE3-ERU4]